MTRLAVYSNEELEKSEKQEVTLSLPAAPLYFLWASLGSQTFVSSCSYIFYVIKVSGT